MVFNIEVHNDPENALCDGDQSIKPKRFDQLVEKIKVLATLKIEPLHFPQVDQVSIIKIGSL